VVVRGGEAEPLVLVSFLAGASEVGLTKKGASWYADFYEKGRRVRLSLGPNKAAAEALLSRKIFERSARKVLGRDVGFFPPVVGESEKPEPTLAEVADQFLSVYSPQYHGPATQAFYRECIKRLLPFFGRLRTSQITEKLVADYVAILLREGCKHRTANAYVLALCTILSQAVKWEWIEDNPLRGWHKLPSGPARVRWLDAEEREQLIAACPDWLGRVVRFAILSLMRRDEIRYMQIDQIQLSQHMIVLKRFKGSQRALTLRSVPLLPEAEEVLREQLRVRHIDHPWVWPNPATGKPADLTHLFEAAVKRAGLTDLRFHDLRHTGASYLAQAGVSLRIISEVMGHADLRMTQRYAHLAPGSTLEVLKKVGPLLTSKKSKTETAAIKNL